MLIVPHVVFGAAIGSKIHSPILTIFLAVASHYLLDRIPHWQETTEPYILTARTYIRCSIDLILSIGFLFFLSRQGKLDLNVFLGAIFAIIPDVEGIFQVRKDLLKNSILSMTFPFHMRLQRHAGFLLGVFTQLVVIFISLLIIFEI
ncbi:TPA: hypothetical protein DDW69_00440 [candidate division CPR2 bacterium]|uniref:Uncharacterized protein n=1 Tax=candidate division CPR2 bacterium GW2011_GWC1_41_48 TaxID=1618344 RepID=A0A0G0W9S5_UNCC2|nr:MAG: hypothetical protein UT47_C0004G0102 [candidate division CPR2 bacterium GW2011_GWC2_39_35]KKR28660.1 MAG: hypothetical protein UT60_C0015G0014 [candidate division CPR2 bacterium GW2011_GWD2_39_7]KKS08807.1 MAG: hypothetical protein UU65_C0004G0018 [candidate division CPR2 bacterium GW2011_GWC1_41_48]OGB72963.1 MAG: hypothetical protein A2Y26_02525 [candidate division CPR2 bacterium GWD2_39_7]HBG81292.1 hypothetical protein [candidate division CPR2 bacterium]